MTIYSYAEAHERLSMLLEKARLEGQVKLRDCDGRTFVIRPEPTPEASPLDVRSVGLPVSKADILDAVRESRTKLS